MASLQASRTSSTIGAVEKEKRVEFVAKLRPDTTTIEDYAILKNT